MKLRLTLIFIKDRGNRWASCSSLQYQVVKTIFELPEQFQQTSAPHNLYTPLRQTHDYIPVL
jgi:hypothetical protein